MIKRIKNWKYSKNISQPTFNSEQENRGPRILELNLKFKYKKCAV